MGCGSACQARHMASFKNFKNGLQKMTLGTKSAYAKHIDKSHQYVTKLGKKNRLVMVGKKVDFEKTDALIAATADPGNDPSSTMAKPVESQTEEELKKQIETNTLITHKYQSSRAEKESYAALNMKVEFEKKVGQLVDKDGVSKAAFGVGRILREKLKSIPAKLAPKVTIEMDLKKNHALIEAEMEKTIREIQAAISDMLEKSQQ